MKPSDLNFIPGIRCPYCNHYQHAEISGWGRTGLNVRGKVCHSCGQEFNVVALVFTTEKGSDIPDGEHSSIKEMIKSFRQERKKQLENLRTQLLTEKVKN